MPNQPPSSQVPLEIREPCPKSWGELVGDEKQRFCSECSLHVHNAAQLTQREARTMVTQASSRVCMRIEYDRAGSPIFRDSSPSIASNARTPRRVAALLARWAVSAAAGLLAACHGSVTPVANDPTTGTNAGQPPSKMGNVSTTLLGDVAAPQQAELVKMGEALAPPMPDDPPAHDHE